MKIKEFNNINELQKYYDKETNAYVFKEDEDYIELVIFNFDLIIQENIYAWDIEACNINAKDINYYAVCYAYENIKCKSIKGRKRNAKHFVLDGKMEVEDEN